MEKDYSKVLNQFNNCSTEEKELLSKYLYEENLTEKEIKQLEKIYLKNIGRQKNQIEEKIDTI